MKVVILAGGLGTRLREETEFRPKPMVEIGGRPILWHIMHIYANYGHTDFVVCLGYKGNVIRDYFINYRMRNSDITVTLGTAEAEIHNSHLETGWRVTLAETGPKTLTGGRVKRIAKYIDGNEFMVTYGDIVADVDIDALLRCHYSSGKQATVTAVRPVSRFGELSLENGIAKAFEEKPQMNSSWVNGGFLVFHRNVLDLISGDEANLEGDILKTLVARQELNVYRHYGFWQCMDTFREVELLNQLWAENNAIWLRPPQIRAIHAGGQE